QTISSTDRAEMIELHFNEGSALTIRPDDSNAHIRVIRWLISKRRPQVHPLQSIMIDLPQWNPCSFRQVELIGDAQGYRNIHLVTKDAMNINKGSIFTDQRG